MVKIQAVDENNENIGQPVEITGEAEVAYKRMIDVARNGGSLDEMSVAAREFLRIDGLDK